MGQGPLWRLSRRMSPNPLLEDFPPTCGGVLQLDIAWGHQVQQRVRDQPIEALVRVHSSYSDERGSWGGPLQNPLRVAGDPEGLELGRVVIDIQDVDCQLGWSRGRGEDDMRDTSVARPGLAKCRSSPDRVVAFHCPSGTP